MQLYILLYNLSINNLLSSVHPQLSKSEKKRNKEEINKCPILELMSKYDQHLTSVCMKRQHFTHKIPRPSQPPCAILHLTCMPCPWTLCSCSWMCLSSSCCRWMLAWIILVLCSSCSLRCCMAFTCAENSITGCGWTEKKNRSPTSAVLTMCTCSNWCSNVHYENTGKLS